MLEKCLNQLRSNLQVLENATSQVRFDLNHGIDTGKGPRFLKAKMREEEARQPSAYGRRLGVTITACRPGRNRVDCLESAKVDVKQSSYFLQIMHYLVITDIADPHRLRRAARICERWGERVQKSVYLMELGNGELLQLQAAMRKILHHCEDSARYYPLCSMGLVRSGGEGLGCGLKPGGSHWIV